MTPTLELRLLVAFEAIMECGCITRAADQLGIAQPALSRALQMLECRLGTSLVDRTPHGITPRPAGEQFYALARDLLNHHDAVLDGMEPFRTGAWTGGTST